MANNALPSPAAIDGINRAWRGDGKGRDSGRDWMVDGGDRKQNRYMNETET